MKYENFISQIQKYWDLRSRGLKKQANSFLFQFIESFENNVCTGDTDEILFRFCREYIDELKFLGGDGRRRHLPFQMTKLLEEYFKRECLKNKMPQMRWAFQIFGAYYNPNGSFEEQNPYYILEKAYAHKQCDQRTVDIYFREQLNNLWMGQHHFPEYSCITKEEFDNTVQTAQKILSEKTIDQPLVEEFSYYVKLYRIYFEWQENGRIGSFYELCESAGIQFESIPAFYYENE